MALMDYLVASKEELRKMEDQLDNLISTLQGIQKQEPFVVPPPAARRRQRSTVVAHRPGPKGNISMAQAVLEALQEAAPEAVHCQDLYDQAVARGASTTSDKPAEAVDLLLYKQRQRGIPIEKVGKRLWKWVGEPGQVIKTFEWSPDQENA